MLFVLNPRLGWVFPLCGHSTSQCCKLKGFNLFFEHVWAFPSESGRETAEGRAAATGNSFSREGAGACLEARPCLAAAPTTPAVHSPAGGQKMNFYPKLLLGSKEGK